ncbi:MAG: hypothetical protein J0H20_09810, partial [Rhizobiales bacterium]|nr:hypothetical protein [Hyphomicrobiales bacterium]
AAEAEVAPPKLPDAVAETNAPDSKTSDAKVVEAKAADAKRGDGKKSESRKAPKSAGPAMVKAIEDALVDLKEAVSEPDASTAEAAAAKPAEASGAGETEAVEKRKADDAA